MVNPARRGFPGLLNLLGGTLALVGFVLSASTLLLDLFGPHRSHYLGLLTFLVFPAILFLGLFLAALGWVLRRRRLRRHGAAAVPPAAPEAGGVESRLYLGLGGLGLAIVLLSAVGAYRAYEFTESVAFCGRTCHSIMEPEYVAYQSSAHARVKCVECHVGSGADSYLKAKIDGLYRVASLVTGGYSRPIPTPIHTLRPAQETCEECHWPEKFWGSQLAPRTRFGFDAANSRHEVLLLMRTGGGSPGRGPSGGIHWHMNLKNRIEYVARDRLRLEIPWVRSSPAEGPPVEYVDSEKPLSAEELRTLERRRMDCLDCHNRPAHQFLSAAEGVDRSLELRRLDPSVPYLKEAATLALCKEYGSLPEAESGLLGELRSYYSREHPRLLEQVAGRLPASAEELKQVYRQNFFPAMHAAWNSYPSHIGHRESPGCFRCHDGKHTSPDGKTIRKDCGLCHSLIERQRDGGGFVEAPSDGASFHPWKHEKHSRMDCSQCHGGEASPYKACGKCHEPEAGAPMAFACSSCHKPMKVKVENADCAPCHPLVKSKLHAVAAHGDCIACHKQHEWKTVSYPDDCTQSCHKTLKDPHHPGEPCAPCHDFRGVPALLGARLEARGPSGPPSGGGPHG